MADDALMVDQGLITSLTSTLYMHNMYKRRNKVHPLTALP